MGTSKGNIGRQMYSDPKYRLKLAEAVKLKRITVKKICPKCNTLFKVERRISKNGEEIIDKYERNYCSHKCANSRTWTKEDNIKKSLSSTKIIKERTCPICGKVFEKKRSITCSKQCGKIYRYRNIDKESLKYYRLKCQFNFALSNYPSEFDFYLIEEYGWYRAKNRGDNLNGISRDHMVSVKYGWENNISPEIISHPANCKLLRHNSNVSKFDSCSITYDELLKRIDEWNSKYGVVV